MAFLGRVAQLELENTFEQTNIFSGRTDLNGVVNIKGNLTVASSSTVGIAGPLTATGTALFKGATTVEVTANFTNGTKPFNVTGKSLVTNLNADMLDGKHATDFALAANSASFDNVEGFYPKRTVFNSDGSITETLSSLGATKRTVFNSNGSITETWTDSGKTLTKQTVFNSDGSIVSTIA